MSDERDNSSGIPSPRDFQSYREFLMSYAIAESVRYMLSITPIERVRLMEQRTKEAYEHFGRDEIESCADLAAELSLRSLYEIRKLREQGQK
ncbi:MAG TPA: hypothetical protein VFE46_19780 [Pirellulales bacterium]|jgi:hypothetical protein|nr:hypothetical protein [Pirellulales bacterium]